MGPVRWATTQEFGVEFLIVLKAGWIAPDFYRETYTKEPDTFPSCMNPQQPVRSPAHLL
jgi:hypothetical protein